MITMEELRVVGAVRKRHTEVYNKRGQHLQVREDVQTLLEHIDALVQNIKPTTDKKVTRG